MERFLRENAVLSSSYPEIFTGLVYTEYRPSTLIQFKGRFTKKVTAQVLTMDRSRSGTHSSDVGQGDVSSLRTGTGRVWLN